MTSHQRTYRPPTSTARQTSLHRHEGLNDFYSDLQDAQVSQAPTSAQEVKQHSSLARPTPADQAANLLAQGQLEAERSSFNHLIYRLLASTARPSLADQLERFTIASPTIAELSDFQRCIEQECLLRSINPNAHTNASTGTVVQITLYLSGPVLQWSDPQSGRFRDLQLRTLVAAFALLHHSGLTELTAEPHDQLRSNIAARFNDMVDGRRASQMSLEERMRHADALYLIRLVAQYFSLIKRAQPLSDAVSIPILGLVLAGASVAGGQYNGLGSAFRYADEVIGLIPGRKSRYLNLPAIQELTRNATAVFSFAETIDNDEVDVEETQLALQVGQLIQQLLRVHIQNIPSKKSSIWDWPLARFRRGPPRMDEWYFFYGLLDCLSQVARHIRHGQPFAELFAMLRQLMEDSEYEETRWKIVEIFEAYEPVRRNIHQWLRASNQNSNIDDAVVLKELAAVRAISRQQMPTDSQIGRTVSRQTTSSTDVNEGRLLPANRISSSQTIDNRPLHHALAEAQYSNRRPSAQAADVDAVEQIPTTQDSVLTSSTEEHGRSLSLVSQEQNRTPPTEEAEEPERYLEGHLEYWWQDGAVQESFGRGFRGYAHAGLSTDCQLAFFYSSRELCVARVSLDTRRRRKEDLVLERKYDKRSQIADVALLNNILAVSTRQNLELHRIRHPGPGVTVSHGDWDPLGIASWEQDSNVMVAMGLRKGAGSSRNGRVVIHQVRAMPGGSLQRRTHRQFNLPRGVSPKSLVFDPEGTTLACITDRVVGNSVIIWRIGETMEDEDSVVIARHQHRPETDSDGLTSIAMYKSPSQSQQSYIFCTTSASTERFRSEGEWSFISPVPFPGHQVPPNAVHDLTTLQDHRQIVACAVSSVANKFAVLTKAGKIIVLALNAHEEGGIDSLQDEPDILPGSLCSLRSSRATPTCLRFDPTGTKLYVVDPEGKLLVVRFKPEDCVSRVGLLAQQQTNSTS
ncbi:MAG: hypothetical protein Q9198_005547 [Flavoplaca austrocitrina]